MLKKLKIDKFTVFSQEDFIFSKQLTVCIGENATGKSHILKLAYVILRALARRKNDIAKEVFARKLGSELIAVFKPDHLGRLVSRERGHSSCEIEAQWGKSGKLAFTFSTRASELVSITELQFEPLPATALFIPPKEILSVFAGFQGALEARELGFDATYLDLAKALNSAPLKGPRLQAISKYLNPIENVLECDVRQENGQFYFHSKRQKGSIEAQLVAEGHRKIGMLAYLLRNGTLMKKSTLLWDEPEANMNPKLIRHLAEILFKLSADMQVVVATHSLFLLKEFEILAASSEPALDIKFIGLYFDENKVKVEQAKEISELSSIVSLDEELNQSDRFMQIEA